MTAPLELFTLEEVARTFRVSPRTMREHVKAHPYYRMLGGRRLFTRADIRALYEALECPSSSSADPAVRTGTCTELSEASLFAKARVADAKAAEAIRARREWEIIQRSVFGTEATATFVGAAVSYLEAGGERTYLKPIIARIGSMSLAKIDQDVIDKTARALYPDASPATLNRQAYTPIVAVLHHAAKRKLCAKPVVERPKQPNGMVQWITFEEAERLIAACAKHLRPLVLFLLGTGARMSEALYLDWRDVNLELGQVTFPETKNGEARSVPLHARVVSALRGLRHKQGRVFRRPDGLPYAQKDDGGGQIKTAFNGACRRAGITNFSPHKCRHTWATWHYAANRDLIALMKLGGWKSERMVLRYAHVNVTQFAPSIAAGLAAWDTKSAPSDKREGRKLRRVK